MRRGQQSEHALLIFPRTDCGTGWIWHLVVADTLRPVAVVSQGQSLNHS